MAEDKPTRKHLNAAQKRALKAADIALFSQQYSRKAVRGIDPNDRRYDREVEKTAKTMRPEDLDRLMRDDED